MMNRENHLLAYLQGHQIYLRKFTIVTSVHMKATQY